MRLLSRLDGKLHFSRVSNKPEPYAILSHRWLADEEEVTYADVVNGAIAKPGYQKIDFCLERAGQDGYNKVWVDSACIDRSNSTELAEALNSMFKWYAGAAVCYVYLSDVEAIDMAHFLKSDWFRRGWTLQELIAPADVRFFSADRRLIGDKTTLLDQISTITSFGSMEASLPERFAWSLNRQTTRPEDMSYCMLGLLEVSLGPLYGEGAEAAQDRLFEAVEKKYGRGVVRAFWQAITKSAQISVVKTDAEYTQEREDLARDRREHELRERVAIQQSEKEKQEQERLRIEREKRERKKREKELLNTLSFENMNLRRGAIAHPFPDTCAWLLRNEAYQQWLSKTGHRFLWIKGKAGAGKSTLVKFADSSAETDQSISFYFNARGTALEQSAIGVYRSLLYQLLSKSSSLRSHVLGRLDQEKQYTRRTDWSLPSLQNAFREAVEHLSEPIQCFIDALDECDESEVQDMVYFMEDVSRGALLYICFASRYYPSVLLDSPEIHLEEQTDHGRDLREYVNGRLHASTELKQKVMSKANGVFLWAVLVVKQLNEEIRAGAIYNIQTILDELPSELIELLRAIAIRQEHQERFSICMQWLMYSFQPLRVGTFCAGVLLGMSDHGTKEAAMSIFNGTVGQQQMRQWVAVWSRGLAEVVSDSSRGDKLNVQIIHESVRGFFLGSEGRLSGMLLDQESQIHDNIKNACRTAMSLMCNPPVSFPFTTKKRAVHISQTDILSYANSAMLKHAELAAKGLSQSDFMQTYVQAKSSADYRTLWQMLGDSNDGFDNKYFSTASILRTLVSVEASSLIHTAREIGVRLGRRDQGSDPLLIQAVRTSRVHVVQALLEFNQELDVTDEEGNTALHLVVQKRDLSLCSRLMDCGASPELQNIKGQTALHNAVIAGMHLRDGSKTGETVLCELQPARGIQQHMVASKHNAKWHKGPDHKNVQLLEILLTRPLESTRRDNKGLTALMYAALVDSDRSISLLLGAGMPIEDTDDLGNTALLLACAAGRTGSVRRLLSAGANANATNSKGVSPLVATCTHEGFELAHGHAAAMMDMCSTTDREYVNYAGVIQQYSNMIHNCDNVIVKLLLQHGAKPDLQDPAGRTALMVACTIAKGQLIIESLLDSGAALELTDDQGRTALRSAIANWQKDSIIMLIRRGAALQVPDKQGVTALSSLIQATTLMNLLADRNHSEQDSRDIMAALEARGIAGETGVLEVLYQSSLWAKR